MDELHADAFGGQPSGELLRVYSGTKTEQWQIEVEGRIDLSNIQIGTSVKELGLV